MRLKRRPKAVRRKPAARRQTKAARQPGQDWVSKLVRAFVGALVEGYKLVREMLVIPAQLWLFVAEIAGAAVLRAWRSVVLPALRLSWRALVFAYRLAARHVTPARATAAVAVCAAIALIASQWVDYRAVSVGSPAYEGELGLVAPAPDVDRDRAGDAHGWVMVPLAVLGAIGALVAISGRRRAAWFTVGAGVGAIVIAVAIDAPKGLDEGGAALAYEGAAAELLEGFWAQIASAGALAVCGLLLALRPRERTAVATSARRPPRRPRRKPRLRLPSISRGPKRLEGQSKLNASAGESGA
jgi:hypothetical protein